MRVKLKKVKRGKYKYLQGMASFTGGRNKSC
jgi:hypothetical protein